jgi:hypothetical protein
MYFYYNMHYKNTMKKNLTLVAILYMVASSSAQNSTNFSWSTYSANVQSVSPAIFPGCDTATHVTLTTQAVHIVNFNGTGPYSSGQPTTSVLIPSSAAASSLSSIDITLSFSTPVAGFRLLVRDIDDEYDDGNPEETLSNFSLPPSQIVPVVGTYNWTGGVLTPTDNNTRFWIEWNNAPITSVTFRYSRSIVNYAVLFDSLTFTCLNPKAIGEINNQDLPAVITYNTSKSILSLIITDENVGGYLNVYSISGQLIINEKVNQTMYELNMATQSSGIYIAEYYFDNRSKRERFIVAQ